MRAARQIRETAAATAAVQDAFRTPGAPLPEASRAELEAAFGRDLSHVRVHADAAAAAAAVRLGAEAFTVGRDIFFAAGAFAPDSARGRGVLAHEVAHTLQDARTVRPEEVSAADITRAHDAREAAAHGAAAAIIAGGAVAVAASADGRARISRLAAGEYDRRDPGDPAQIVALVSDGVRTSLSADPDDRRGKVRRTLLRLEDKVRRAVFERLEAQMVSTDWRHLLEVLDAPGPSGADGADAAPARDETPGEAVGEEPGAAQIDAETPVEARVASDPATEGTMPDAAAASEGAVNDNAPTDAPAPDAGVTPNGGGGASTQTARSPKTPRGASGAGASVRGGVAQPRAAAPPLSMGSAAEAAELPEAASPDAATTEGRQDAAREIEADTELAGEARAEEAEPRSADVQGPPPPAPEPTGLSEAPAPSAPAQDRVEGDAEAASEEAAGPGPASDNDSSGTGDAPAAEAEATLAADAGPAPAPTDSVDAPTAAGAAAAGPAPLSDLPSDRDDGAEDAGGGGGGGGGAIADPPAEAPVTVSGADPAAAMSSVAELAPAGLGAALGGVGDSVKRGAAADRAELAAAPPQATPPAAPPGGAQAAPAFTPAATPAPVERVDLGSPSAQAVALVGGEGALNAPLPTVKLPQVTSNAQGEVTASDVKRVGESVAALPVTDAALNVTAGPPPTLALAGAADPGGAAAQKAAVDRAALGAAEAARTEAAQPLGEDHITPTFAAEALTGVVPPAAGRSSGPAPIAPPGVAIAAVAREKSGEAVRAKAQAAAQSLSSARTEQSGKLATARVQSQDKVAAATQASLADQAKERAAGRQAVSLARQDWGEARRGLARDADGEAVEAVVGARRDTAAHQVAADTEAAGHIATGNAQIADARHGAEAAAKAEHDKASSEAAADGFFSRAASAVGDFFEGVKKAIHTAFEAARTLVKKAVDAAQALAAKVIDKARELVVAVVRKAADALIALGDRVLAGFPKLRDAYRKTIEGAVKLAVAAVNLVAKALKTAVKALLDVLGGALCLILDAYEAVYSAIVDVVGGFVKGVLDAAKGLVMALRVLADVIKDVAANPGQWVRNLGAAMMDGVRNHLWKALKLAIKTWFNDKVEQVVGLGRTIFNVLLKGGIDFSRIAAMAWAAVKAAIPRAIAEFLIQKVVSLLIPAASAVFAIIEALQAGWATASKIIAAFNLFASFLKAVRGGGAGPQFATAVAAAAVVVIEFTANFILSKIAKGAKSLGKRLKGVADKVMEWLKRGAAAVKRGLGAVKKGAQAVGRAIVRGAKAVGRGVMKVGRWVANSRLGRYVRGSRLGKAVGRLYARGKARVAKVKKSFQDWRKKRNSPEARRERLERAARELPNRLKPMMRKGMPRIALRAFLLGSRVYYGLRVLKLDQDRVAAANSPGIDIAKVYKANETELSRMIYDIGKDLLDDEETKKEAARLISEEENVDARRKEKFDDSMTPTMKVRAGVGYLGGALAARRARKSGFRTPHLMMTSWGQRSVVNRQQSVNGPGGMRVGAAVLPKKGRRRVNYDALVDEISAIRKSVNPPMSDAAFANHLREFVQQGHTHGPFGTADGAAVLADFSHIAFSVETARSTAFAAEGPMLAHLVESGNLTTAEAFARSSDVNPMSMVGAAAANRRHESRLFGLPDKEKSGTIDKNHNEVKRRRQELFLRYVRAELALEDAVFYSEEYFMEWARTTLRERIRNRAREYYAMAGSPRYVPILQRN